MITFVVLGDYRIGMSTGLRDRERVPLSIIHLQGTTGRHCLQLRTVPFGSQNATGWAQHLFERRASVD